MNKFKIPKMPEIKKKEIKKVVKISPKVSLFFVLI